MVIASELRSTPVALLGLGTATPPGTISQDEVAATAHAIFADRYPEFQRLSAVYQTSGIRKRHFVMPIDWYRSPRGWPERTAAYLDGAGLLFEDATRKALIDADLTADDVDAIVTVSSTGIATPSLDVRSFPILGFRPSTRRVPVFGLGCAGGVSGLGIAANIARGMPGQNVLFVAVEVCSLAFRLDDLTKANIVASALFGDGAAACLLRAGDARPSHPLITAAGEHTWPQTIDLMGWNVDPEGFGVIFARAIPPFARANMGAAVTTMLAAADHTPADVDRFICHPGGAKVVDALEHALGLEADSLNHERAILADYGNMSAPTVLFVLERMLAEGLPNRSALVAMGPGFSASTAIIECTS